MAEIKKKIFDLKKDMLFTNSLKKKITKNIINTPRTFRTDVFLLPVDNNLQLTSRTNKSVHFENEELVKVKDENNNNIVQSTPRTEKYIKLLNSIDMPPLSSRSDMSIESKALNLSLPLSLDPLLNIDSYYNNDLNTNRLERQSSRSEQSLKTNEDFLLEYELESYFISKKKQNIF
jgi:hypothetical protein